MAEQQTELTNLGDLSDEDLERVESGEVANKWPAVLAEMVDVLVAEAKRAGSSEEDAAGSAERTVLVLASHFGGHPFYLPRGDRLRIALRDRRIYRMHNGRNSERLAEHFGLTTRQVQRIYADQRSLATRKRQQRLFDDAANG